MKLIVLLSGLTCDVVEAINLLVPLTEMFRVLTGFGSLGVCFIGPLRF